MKLCWEAIGGALGSCVRGPLTYDISTVFKSFVIDSSFLIECTT